MHRPLQAFVLVTKSQRLSEIANACCRGKLLYTLSDRLTFQLIHSLTVYVFVCRIVCMRFCTVMCVIRPLCATQARAHICIHYSKLLFVTRATLWTTKSGTMKLNYHQIFAVPSKAISLMTSNQECVNDIAASDVLVYLLLALHTLPAGNLHASLDDYPG